MAVWDEGNLIERCLEAEAEQASGFPQGGKAGDCSMCSAINQWESVTGPWTNCSVQGPLTPLLENGATGRNESYAPSFLLLLSVCNVSWKRERSHLLLLLNRRRMDGTDGPQRQKDLECSCSDAKTSWGLSSTAPGWRQGASGAHCPSSPLCGDRTHQARTAPCMETGCIRHSLPMV